MARLGRSHPIPPTIKSPLRFSLREITLGVFESVSEWPAVEVTTPNVSLFLPPFESASEWPTLSFVRDQVFTLSAFESVSEWPTLTVSIPIKPGDSLTGADGEIEWNGTLWGPTTDVRVLVPVEGWLSMPGIDNLNVEKPTQHGAWDARKLAQQRIVSFQLQPNSRDDPTQVQTLIDAITSATGIPESEDPLPLVIKAYGEPKLAFGQVIARPLVLDGDYNVGLPTVGVVIACGDPRLYGLEPHGVTVAVSTPTAIANAGNAATHPIIRLEGPVTNPVLVNSTLGRTLQFSIVVPEGEILEIVTGDGTVTMDGDNQMSTLAGSSVPVQDFVLAAGSNLITYTVTSGGGGGADFLWRDATL